MLLSSYSDRKLEGKKFNCKSAETVTSWTDFAKLNVSQVNRIEVFVSNHCFDNLNIQHFKG